jgi:hypothetical protein
MHGSRCRFRTRCRRSSRWTRPPRYVAPHTRTGRWWAGSAGRRRRAARRRSPRSGTSPRPGTRSRSRTQSRRAARRNGSRTRWPVGGRSRRPRGRAGSRGWCTQMQMNCGSPPLLTPLHAQSVGHAASQSLVQVPPVGPSTHQPLKQSVLDSQGEPKQPSQPSPSPVSGSASAGGSSSTPTSATGRSATTSTPPWSPPGPESTRTSTPPAGFESPQAPTATNMARASAVRKSGRRADSVRKFTGASEALTDAQHSAARPSDHRPSSEPARGDLGQRRGSIEALGEASLVEREGGHREDGGVERVVQERRLEEHADARGARPSAVGALEGCEAVGRRGPARRGRGLGPRRAP